MKSFFVIACVSAVALAYIKDTFQVLPVPDTVTYGKQESARLVNLGSPALVVSNNCDSECQTIVFKAFDFSINSPLQAQRGLQPWKLSPHPEFATAPVVAASLPDAITQVNVTFTGLAPVVPQMLAVNKTLEHYEINIGNTGSVDVKVHTVWGALHALETLVQLFEWNGQDFVVQRVPLSIVDEPRFPWRGFMVDCSRHYVPFAKLRRIVDGLVSFKINVLHMHLSDAQSFPMDVPDLPSLAKSAFYPKAVYSTKDMTDFIAYARNRGIMVVPEVDIPAHTASWRYISEDVTANCFQYLAGLTGVYEENLVALNPASSQTWSAIDTILKHYSKTFSTSAYTHVGGDEVSSTCWEQATQSDAIRTFMSQHSISTYKELEAYFDHYTQKMTTTTGKTPIVWEDVLQNNAVEPGSIVHAWRSHDTLVQAVRQGNLAFTSYPYYLDREDPLCSGTCNDVNWMFSWTYRDMYKTDPTVGLGLTPEEEARVLGGEAALWAESIDTPNFDTMAFSRLGAFAERFWSPSTVTDPKNLEQRSQRLRCLNVKRGLTTGAGPLSSDFCETAHFYE